MASKKTKKKSSKKKTAAKRKSSPIMFYSSRHAGMRRTAQQVPLGTAGGGTSGSASPQGAAMSPLYYDYRWSTPDKFYFPRTRAVANRIWREVYMRDAAVAAATDVYAELPWSKFDLIGIDDGDVRKLYEDMFNELNLVPKFPNYTRDFMLTGEFIPHAIFNSRRGIWERIISHNPDYVRVEGLGLAFEQPLLWLRPTPEIRKLLNSPDPRVRKFQKLIPKDILNAFRMNQEIALDPLNTTYIPRLNNSNNVRGTSLYTRLFRVIMYEDFIVNASLAVAQRNAAPLRIFKLGDPNTGWLPDADAESQFAEMLALAESDPMAAIIMHHNVTAELVGVSDRVLLISREWDFIERVKLLAMGVAKSFLVGETSFAAAVAGLQTLLERLAALRYKFEHEWIIKKLCEPIAEMHGFHRRTQSELEHRIRIQKPEERELLIPQLKWHKSLEPTQESSILAVWDRLYEYGILSERTYSSGAGIDLELERKNIVEEAKYNQEKKEKFQDMGIETEEEEEMGGGGLGLPPAPGGGGGPGGAPKPPEASRRIRRRGRTKKENIRQRKANPYIDYEAEEQVEQLDRMHAQHDNGVYGLKDQDEIEARIEEMADSQNKIDVNDVKDILRREDDGVLKASDKAKLDQIEKQLPSAGGNLLSGV
jgi:hypothetical protein